MAEEHRSAVPRDRNRSLREHLDRSEGHTIDLSTTELEIALKDLRDLARSSWRSSRSPGRSRWIASRGRRWWTSPSRATLLRPEREE